MGYVIQLITIKTDWESSTIPLIPDALQWYTLAGSESRMKACCSYGGKDERIAINSCVYKEKWICSDCKKIPNAQTRYNVMPASSSSSPQSLHLVSAHIQSVSV